MSSSSSSITVPSGTIDLTQLRQQMMKSFELQQLVEKENVQLKQQIQQLRQTNIDNANDPQPTSSSLSEEQIHQLIQANQYLQDSVNVLKTSLNNLKADYQKYTKTTLSDYTTLKFKFTQFIILIKALEKEKTDLNGTLTKQKKENDKIISNYKNEQNKQNQMIEKLTKEYLDLQNISKGTSESDTKYKVLQIEYEALNKKYNDLLPKMESARGTNNSLKSMLQTHEQTIQKGLEQLETLKKAHSKVINVHCSIDSCCVSAW